MQPGLSSFAYTFGVGVDGVRPAAPLGPLDLVDETARLGLEVLQLADNVPVAALGDEELAALRAHARGRAIRLELGGRGLTAESLARHVAVARVLGARVLRFVVDAPGHEPPADEVVALLRDARGALAEADVTLALENHDRFTVAELAGIVDAVGDPRVGVCLDTANSLGSGEGLGEVLRVLAPLAVNLHVKDFTIARRRHGMGFEVRGARLGTGRLDLPVLLDAVGRHGNCATAVLEQWAPERPSAEEAVALERAWAEESSAVLRKVLAAARRQPQRGAP